MKQKNDMNRVVLDKYIKDTYNSCAEFLWQSAPSYAVYRHNDNRKWFAVIMEIPKCKIGLQQDGNVDVVNLKCHPILISSLVEENGIHRGYHMNKNYWITVRLDGSVDDDRIKWLIGMSFELTEKKKK